MHIIQHIRNFLSVPFFAVSIACNAVSMFFKGLDAVFTRLGVKMIGVSQEEYDNF